MFKLLKNIKGKDWIIVGFICLMIIGQVVLELKMPDYMSNITRLVETEGSKLSEIIKNGAFMMLCALSSFILAVIVGYLISYIASKFSMNVRSSLFKKIVGLSMQDIKAVSTSSLITRTTNDVSQVEMIIGMGMQMLIKAPLTAIIAVTKILNKSVTWSMYTALSVVILLSVVGVLTIIVVPKFKIVQKLIDHLNGVTKENLHGIRVVRAFNAEKYQENKFGYVNNKLTNQQLFNQTAFAAMQPIMYLVMHTLTLVIYFSGAFMLNSALMSEKIVIFGNMVVFTSYATQVITSFLMLAFIFMMIPRAQVSAGRINEVMNIEGSVKDGNGKEKLQKSGTIEFADVSFKYPDAEEYVLKNISFKVEKGETIAFIGSTGSGKSTLINLITRFYDVTDGSILIDGRNIKDFKLEELYNLIGYVPQKAVLFDGTVKSNVGYGKTNHEVTEEDIIDAIETAQAKEFVEKMDNQYNSHIAQGGSNVSGGQKQRLSIARAIARKPEIYIFDDSFSALDYKTDSILRKALKKNSKDITTVIVAQRIGTIMNADKIVVLDNGECVGIGTHKELLKNCPIYHQIATSQITEKELENASTR